MEHIWNKIEQKIGFDFRECEEKGITIAKV